MPKAEPGGGIVVSLPMYNLPEMAAANDAFWTVLRRELVARGLTSVPKSLDLKARPVPAMIDSQVLFSQVCGYPLQTIFKGQVRLLGKPQYDCPGCAGATHCGVFVVNAASPARRLEDLRGARFVFNSVHSNSGMNLPRRSIAEIAGGKPFFTSVAMTDSHPLSLELVARGAADATCVDNVTYAFNRDWRPEIAERTRALAYTVPSPSIPFVTSVATDEATARVLRNALFAVFADPSREAAAARVGLKLVGLEPAADDDYAGLLDYERDAAALGYLDLA